VHYGGEWSDKKTPVYPEFERCNTPCRSTPEIFHQFTISLCYVASSTQWIGPLTSTALVLVSTLLLLLKMMGFK